MALTKAELIELITAHEHERSTAEGEESSVINALKAFLTIPDNSNLPPHALLRFTDFATFSPETTIRDLTAAEQNILAPFKNMYSTLEESPTLCFYVNKGYLSLVEARDLTKRHYRYPERKNLTSHAIKAWVSAGLLSFAKARDLTEQQWENLVTPAIKAWIDAGLLSFAEALHLTYQQWKNLGSPEIKAWVDEGFLTVAKARNLTHQQWLNLNSPRIKAWIDASFLSFAEAQDLTEQQGINLATPEIKAWMDAGLLSFAKARDLTQQQRYNLVAPEINAWIGAGHLSFAEALNLTDQQRKTLVSPAIKVLTDEKCITFKDALALNRFDRALLQRLEIQALLRSRARNEATLASLTDIQKVFLATLMRNTAEERRYEACKFRFFHRNAATFHDLVQLLHREQETAFLENLPVKPSRLGSHTTRFADGRSVRENLLHVAARLGRKASMDELVKRGMDLSSLNSETKTALQLYAESQTTGSAAGTTPAILSKE